MTAIEKLGERVAAEEKGREEEWATDEGREEGEETRRNMMTCLWREKRIERAEREKRQMIPAANWKRG